MLLFVAVSSWVCWCLIWVLDLFVGLVGCGWLFYVLWFVIGYCCALGLFGCGLRLLLFWFSCDVCLVMFGCVCIVC